MCSSWAEEVEALGLGMRGLKVDCFFGAVVGGGIGFGLDDEAAFFLSSAPETSSSWMTRALTLLLPLSFEVAFCFSVALGLTSFSILKLGLMSRGLSLGLEVVVGGVGKAGFSSMFLGALPTLSSGEDSFLSVVDSSPETEERPDDSCARISSFSRRTAE